MSEHPGALLGAGFPSPELVAAAVALHDEGVVPGGLVQGGREGRDFLLAVGPGTVGVRLLDHERRERTAAARRHTPRGVLNAAGEWVEPAPTRVITSWSRKSRANMTRALSELDYAPLFAAGRLPAMVTLTYPGDWLAVAPSGAAVKGHVRALMRRWARAWGAQPAYVWKLEFQRRGAPHLHLFAVPEPGSASCSCCGQRLDFRGWLSHAWADVVGADDQAADEHGNTERRRHQLAGTGVDFREGARAKDPKRLAVYFTKHNGAAPGAKEYQHVVPAAWLTPETGPGRFWGYSGLVRVRREVHVTRETYVQFRRALRRLAESRQLRREVRVPRGQVLDVATGEITTRRRKVTRRRRHLGHGGLNGGFVLVNDGPALAAALARWP